MVETFLKKGNKGWKTPPRSLEDFPLNLRTSGEWNTTAARRQVQTPDICTFPAKGELACRECSDH
jgi:hypothetical protein